MRKRLGSRIAFISALAMLATEVLSPVAVIAAEDVVAESEYVEAFSQEEAYAEDVVDAELEDVQAADSESVEISGVEETVDDEEPVELAGVEDEEETSEDVVAGEENLEEDVLSEPSETYSGYIDLDICQINIDGGFDDNKIKTIVSVTQENGLNVVTILKNGTYSIFGGNPGEVDNRRAQGVLVRIADGVSANIELGNVYVDNIGPVEIDAPMFDVGKNCVVKFGVNENNPEGYVAIADVEGCNAFIKGEEGSVITMDMGIRGVNISGQYGDENAAIITEGTLNFTGGTIEMQSLTSHAVIADSATVNFTGSKVYVYGIEASAVSAVGGTVNVKDGGLYLGYSNDDSLLVGSGAGEESLNGRLVEEGPVPGGIIAPAVNGEGGNVNISGGEMLFDVDGDGIEAENVDISGGDVSISVEAGGYKHESFYDLSGESGLNTLSEKDGVKTERINVDLGSHKGIKVGQKAKTIKFEDGGADDITVPASGSLKISGGRIWIDTSDTGNKFNAVNGNYNLKPTAAGVYIVGAPDDALYSGQDIEISGGKLKILASDAGMTAGGKVTVTKDSKIDIIQCYEGIEGADVTIGEKNATVSPNVLIGKYIREDDDLIPGGYYEGFCLDDGICADAKTETVTYDNYEMYREDAGCNYTRETTSSKTEATLKTYAGNVDIYIDSEGENCRPICSVGGERVEYLPCGDGIDAEGTYDDRGGFVRVYGDSDDDNIPFETNDDFIFTVGPWMLGTGTDKDGKSLPTAGAGVYLVWGGKSGDAPTGGYENDVLGDGEFSFKAKDKFVVKDSKDQVIYEDELPFGGTFIIFGCPLLKAGEKYKVTVGDKEPKEFTGLRKNETDPVDPDDNPEDPDGPGKDKDPSISVNNVLGYTVSYNSSISYNGAKIYLPYFVFDGAKVGGTLSNNTIIFKKIKYKNNKFVGTAQMRLQFKAAKKKADGSKFSKEEKAKIKAEVKKLNDYFKKNFLTFEIVQRQLLENEVKEVKGKYKSKGGKFSIKIKLDTKATNAKGKALKPIKIKAVNKKGKGDFDIDVKSFNEKTGTVTLVGKNNFKGTCTVKGIIVK